MLNVTPYLNIVSYTNNVFVPHSNLYIMYSPPCDGYTGTFFQENHKQYIELRFDQNVEKLNLVIHKIDSNSFEPILSLYHRIYLQRGDKIIIVSGYLGMSHNLTPLFHTNLYIN